MNELQDGRDYDNRDPREVGREAAARGEATMRQLVATQRALDAAIKDLRQIAAELRGKPATEREAWPPLTDAEVRVRLGIEP